MTLPTLRHNTMGAVRVGNDTPVYFASMGDGTNAAVWFQLPFETYDGYSMEDSVYEKLSARNVQNIFLVDYDNGALYEVDYGLLQTPEKVIIPSGYTREKALDEMRLPPIADTLLREDSFVHEPNADSSGPQRLVPKRKLRLIEPNLDRLKERGTSYRTLMFEDFES